MASAPVCLRYLAGLDRTLQAITALPADAQRHVLATRLAPNMLPFERQVAIAAQFSLRTTFPLAGLPVPPQEESAATLPGLHQQINRATSLLKELKPAHFDGAADRTITERAGLADLALPAPQFLYEFAMPNFLFHVCMAYAIARSQGIPVGKADYDGFHHYEKTA